MRGANCKHDVWSVIALGRYVGTLFLPMLGMVWRYQLVWIMDAHMPWQERILVAIRQTRCRPNSTDGWTLEALAHCFCKHSCICSTTFHVQGFFHMNGKHWPTFGSSWLQHICPKKTSGVLQKIYFVFLHCFSARRVPIAFAVMMIMCPFIHILWLLPTALMGCLCSMQVSFARWVFSMQCSRSNFKLM